MPKSAAKKSKAEGSNRKAPAASKPKRSREKQQHLKGMEPPNIPALDEAIQEFQEAKEARVLLTNEETEKRTEVIAIMHKHKLTAYSCEGFEEVSLKPTDEKLIVKRAKKTDESNGKQAEAA